ncbi:sodium:calcium antiporter [Halanaerobacter jeridensis]|uniref:Cation:H+ antiporter n=1 Tax=Halanaerobacter jeridensis TaxID=706427 RepID=A0A938XPI8_9FIRM|nr:sodium:calcium antiporter [Halanaerobacter jeridensis]MBM7557038.1 cation:H+ antiporter [Halanaerobacter jeridensis]
MLNLWLIFGISALAIIISGTKLSEYGDIIAVKTGVGEALVGGILIAAATSLPELITSSSSALFDAPNIAIGNLFGSNTFNLMILAVADLFHGPGPFLLKVHTRHILSSLLGILLSALALFFMLANYVTTFQFSIYNIGLGAIIILITYIFGARLTYYYEKKRDVEEKEEEVLDLGISLRKAALGFALSALVIVIAGVALSYSGDKIAAMTALNQTFMGTILVAAATSLPEVVAAISAIRINAYDMAVGNVFGSNIFNMTVIFAADVAYGGGPILSSISLAHGLTALLGLILASIATIGLFYRSEKTFLNIGWDAISIIVIYFFGAYLLFQIGINF